MQNDTDRSSDAEIVRQVHDGNVNAFESVILRYRILVLTIVKKHVPEDAVEEMAQEAFDERVPQREAREVLDWALGKLSAGDRMVLELTYLEGRSVQESAELLVWSKTNVKVRSYKARMKEKLDSQQQKELDELRAKHEARMKDRSRKHHLPGSMWSFSESKLPEKS